MKPARLHFHAAIAALFLATITLPMQAAECDSTGPDQYLCGIASAEDLVQIPGTRWLIASAFAGQSVLNLVDTREKSWEVLFPSDAARIRFDSQRFENCQGPLPATGIVTHGLYITPGQNGRSTLYAVGHGAREAIEVFDITLSDGADRPRIAWVGCIPTPDGQQANSVTALADGSLLATIPVEHGQEFADAMLGRETGAVYRWSVGDGEWSRLDVTALPYANGIEISPDESTFYVASSGLQRIIAYSNTTPPEILGSTDTLRIAPDNLHKDPEGMLVTAGMVVEYENCNPFDEAGRFDLEQYGSCPRPWDVVVTDPTTLATTTIATGEPDAAFSNITMGVVVDKTLWLGTFAGDRVAYRALNEMPGNPNP
ncbi:MAG: SMP-30/gluconolactonase/LRE family protein [Chromatocurvus sp.]